MKSSKLHIFIGIQELIDAGGDVEYEYAWRIKLQDGSKFDDDSEMDYYTDYKFKVGDDVKMVIDDGLLSY